MAKTKNKEPKTRLSKKEILEEIVLCGKNPVHFLDNYCKINHPLRGLIPFKLYDYQKQLVEDFNKHRFSVVLKARQLGISTLTAGYIAWMIMFYRGKEVMVVATKFKVACNLVRKVKAIVKRLPVWLKISEIESDNESSFSLSNGSKVTASTTAGDSGRSEALSLLVVDEAAHVVGLGDIWTALYPCLSTGGRCILLSTPNGCENFFYRTYIDSQNKVNDFHSTMLLWDVHPERDQEWFEKETKNMTPRQIAQELMADFLMSGESVFRNEDIERIYRRIKEPLYRAGIDRNVWIWEEYKLGYSYLLAADVSRGDSEDYSVFVIMKLETSEIVAEYKGKQTPDIFSNMIYNIGRDYGDCMVIVENNSVGYTVLDKLIERQYPNIYYSRKVSHDFIEQYEAENRTDCVPGFSTTVKTRPIIISKFEEYVRNNLIKIYSTRALDEMRTFIWQNGKAVAQKGSNDDIVMSLSICVFVKDTALSVNERDLEYKKAFLDNIIFTSRKIDTTIPGMKGHTNGPTEEQLNTMKEFLWIYKG